jgi:DedD protein
MTPVSMAPIGNSEDTEITLGTGKMLALFFGLVILCATFFGLGYSMARNSGKSTAELLPSPSTSTSGRTSPIGRQAARSAPDAETTPTEPQAPADANNPTPATATPAAGPPDQSAASAAAAGQPVAGVPAEPATPYFVQVAAVTKQEDAQALVDSLKSRQYQAFIADPSLDKLFHVQVGPFNDVKEAENMRTRLVNDGYNPILKK